MVGIIGIGKCVPGESITTKELVTYIGGRLVAGTVLSQIGMKERFFSVDLETNLLKEGCSNSDLAAKAALEAIKNAAIHLNEIDLIILTTSTPDYPSPPTILYVIEKLGINDIPCIELRSGCAGFSQAIEIASLYITQKIYQTVLIIGSEVSSPYLVPFNKTQARGVSELVGTMMTGDGAGALILTNIESGLIVEQCKFGAIGNQHTEGFRINVGGSKCIERADLNMPLVYDDFKAVIKMGPLLIKEALLSLPSVLSQKGKIKYVIPPQANQKIFNLVRLRFGGEFCFPDAELIFSIQKYANTYSASSFLALCDLIDSQTLKNQDEVVIISAEITKFVYGIVHLKYFN
jgi:3-oxoacyl-[acyl-carrier-protein] synthase-3